MFAAFHPALVNLYYSTAGFLVKIKNSLNERA